jgi:hypothetical protein
MPRPKSPHAPAGEDDGPVAPAAKGIALCLGKLADEAAELGLTETHIAIRQAIGACLIESTSLDAALTHGLH